jgi:hypothetical protein
MANEIKLNKTITYESGQLKYSYAPGSISLPQSVRGYRDQTVAVTSAETDVTGVPGSPGLTFIRSLEATTTGKAIVWGTTSALSFRLPPKATAEFAFATSAGVLAMKTEGAISATVNVQVLQFEK